MAAPIGNQFWKQRSKHGRDKIFETPEIMWESACEYFQWCDENPFLERKAMVVSAGGNSGSSIETTELPILRPYTLHGLCLFLHCNTAYFRNFKSQGRGKDEDFSSVITEIEETIYNQKFSGAASGFFNSNIIARDLGLSDRKELDHTGIPDTKVQVTIESASEEDD